MDVRQPRLVGAADPAAVSSGEAFRRLRGAIRDWYWNGLLAVIVAPNRIPPRNGLKGTWIGRHIATFKLSDGARIRCRFEDAGDVIDVYVNREYERANLPWPELTSIVDVGSTVGSFVVWAGRRSPRASFTAIEPNPAVVPFLRDNLRRNQMEARVQVIEAAVGSSSGTAAIEDDRQFSNLLRVVPLAQGRGPSVRMVTLADVLDGQAGGACDLLKIDCEGGEYDILLNASDDVLHRARMIICEYHFPDGHQPEELIDRLVRAGFEVAADHGPPFGLIFAVRKI